MKCYTSAKFDLLQLKLSWKKIRSCLFTAIRTVSFTNIRFTWSYGFWLNYPFTAMIQSRQISAGWSCWLLGTPKSSTLQEHIPSAWIQLLDLCFFNWCLLLRKPKARKWSPRYIGWGRKNKYKTPRIMFLCQNQEKHKQLSTRTENRAYAFMSDYCPNFCPYITFPLSGQVIKWNILKKVLLETYLNVPIRESENPFSPK